MEFDFEDFRKFHEHPSYPYVRSGLYAVLTYAVYALLLLLLNLLIAAAYGGTGVMLYFLQLGLAVLFTNSSFLIFATYDKARREEFLKNNSTVSFKTKGAWKGALADTRFWIHIATIWILYLLFPAKGFSTLSPLITELFRLPPMSPFLNRIIGIVLFVPISFGFSLFAYGDVRKMWLEMPRRLSQTHLFDSTEKKLKRTYSLGSMVVRLAYTTALTFGGAVVLPALLGAIAMAGAVIVMLAQIKWTWIILGVVVVITYYLCIRTRFRFLRRLKKCCKKNGFELVAKKHPYRSLIRDGGGYNLVVKANGKTYYCRILASIKKSNKIYLRTDGTCERARLVRMPTVRLIRKGAFVQVNTMNLDEDREMFRIVSNFDYRFDAEGEKILLFNPVPTFLFRKAEDETSCPLDNGETVGEYKVFSGNGFLRALERDCA